MADYVVKDYVYVPKVNDFNVGGEMIIVYDNYNPYRVSYQSESEYSIRAGVYSPGVEEKQFIFVSTTPITSGIDIFLVSPYMSIVDTITEITTPLPGDLEGYYAVMYFSKSRLSNGIKMSNYSVKWWTNLYELFTAISYGDVPGTNSGVVVTCIATPVTPFVSGVIVTCIGKLLDPNQQGGTSDIGGGEGTFNDYSDPIPIPPLPDISSVDTGLVTLFCPSKEEVASLGAYLWTNFNDFWENLQKLFTNPMDYFIAFNIFPVKPLVTNARQVYIGNWRTSITMPPVVSQWYEHNCGVVRIPEYWGSALDYMPNTRIQLMLPFIGAVQLNTDEVMGKTLSVTYRIDLLSGSCVAFVTVNDSVYYQFTGECAVSVPLTGADWSRIYSAVVGAIGTAIVGGVGVAAASGVTSSGGLVAARSYEAAASAGASWATINETSKGVKGVAQMRQHMLDVTQAAMENAQNAASRSVRRSEGVRNMRLANTINNTVGQVMGAKASIQHSGTISGSAGMLGVREPYLIIEYPNQSLAENYRHYVGYPSNMYAKLNTLQGYTECEQVIPYGIWGTDDELAELIDILKGGVYL